MHCTVHAVQYMPSYPYHTAHNIMFVLTIRILLQILYFTVLDCLYYTTLRYYATVFRTLDYTFLTDHAMLYCTCYTVHTILYHTALLTY